MNVRLALKLWFRSKKINVISFFVKKKRRPLEEHIEIKEGEQYPAEINDTKMIGEEVLISYTVTSAHIWCHVNINVEYKAASRCLVIQM